MGLYRFEFDLLLGTDVPMPSRTSYWVPEDVNITVVRRRPDLVAQLLALQVLLRPRGARTVLINSLDLLKAAVSFFSGRILADASPELQGCREAVLVAVRDWGGALQFANAELQDDRGVVEAAVRECGGALAFASERLKDDADLVLLAIADDSIHGQHGTQRARDQLRAEGRIVLPAGPRRRRRTRRRGGLSDSR